MARFALVRQNDSTDCGAAALATVLRHYDMTLGLEQLRDLTGTDRIGTNMLALMQAAEKLGFSAKGVEGPYSALPRIPLPAIAHVKLEGTVGHFVVLHKADDNRVVVADPRKLTIQKLSREEFSEQWTGRLLILVPDKKLQKIDATGAPVSPWRRFLSLVSGNTTVLVEAFLMAMVVTALGICSSYFVQHLVDNVLVRNETRLLNALGVGMVLILLFRTMFGTLRQYLMTRLGRQIDLMLISNYSRHIVSLPIKFFEMRRVGDILSRFQDAAQVRAAISGTTLTALVDTTMVVIMAAFLWYRDWQLAAVATAFIPVLLGGTLIFHPSIKRRVREAMEHSARVSSHVVEDVTGIETIKAFGAERFRCDRGEQNLVRMVQTGYAIQKINMGLGAVGGIARGGAGLAILWFGGHQVMTGDITLGELMFFNSMLAYMITPLERLAGVNLSLQQAMVSIDRLFQILDIDQERVSDAKLAKFEKLNDGIRLKNVSFKYSCRKNVLENINLEIPAGKTIGIVGESGSGKSTLLKLLLGFHMPVEGEMYIDQTNICDIDLVSLRSQIGVVSQDVFIFNDTIAANISLGSPSASMDEITEVARIAGLHEFISGLPERYQTIIGERGANLSGGERQRLAIARALLSSPDILIFDEATSHLDTATERAVQESLQTVLHNKTVVLVAHRLSTVMDADLIYVMRNGQIVESGTHEQLLARREQYAHLWNIQTGGLRLERGRSLAKGSLPISPKSHNAIAHGLTPNGTPSTAVIGSTAVD